MDKQNLMGVNFGRVEAELWLISQKSLRYRQMLTTPQSKR